MTHPNDIALLVQVIRCDGDLLDLVHFVLHLSQPYFETVEILQKKTIRIRRRGKLAATHGEQIIHCDGHILQ